jgi:hypothetical protein
VYSHLGDVLSPSLSVLDDASREGSRAKGEETGKRETERERGGRLGSAGTEAIGGNETNFSGGCFSREAHGRPDP